MPTLVLIHGSFGSLDFWQFQIEFLSKHLPVLALTLPNHTGSPCEEVPTLELYVSAVRDLLIELEIIKPILGGHSLGGAVCLTLALESSDLVKGLVLLGTGAKLRVLKPLIATAKDNYDRIIQIMRQTIFADPDSPENKEIADNLTEVMQKMEDQQSGYYDFLICNGFNVMDRLEEIQVPTQIICGKDDMLTPPKYSQFMHEKIPNSRLEVIKGRGHFVFLQQPEVVNEIILNFIKGSFRSIIIQKRKERKKEER